MTKTEIRAKAYREARNYMKLMGRPVRWAEMTNADRNLFQFTRGINENVLTRTKLRSI